MTSPLLLRNRRPNTKSEPFASSSAAGGLTPIQSTTYTMYTDAG